MRWGGDRLAAPRSSSRAAHALFCGARHRANLRPPLAGRPAHAGGAGNEIQRGCRRVSLDNCPPYARVPRGHNPH
eukprot:9115856-Alexandrium_andersonii.AAC.1